MQSFRHAETLRNFYNLTMSHPITATQWNNPVFFVSEPPVVVRLKLNEV